MQDKFFLDTNIIVYAFDEQHTQKKKRANQLIQIALEQQKGVISCQVIQEFLNVATRKFKIPMTHEEAEIYLIQVLWPLCVVIPNFELFAHALKLKERHQFSFYDALIVASAIQSRCKKLYSEDLHNGQIVQGLAIENPF